MKFVSTRGNDTATFNHAVIQGLARDGGLFVPEKFPDLSGVIQKWRGLNYRDLAFNFLSFFADDIPPAELRECVDNAYSAFPMTPAPLVKIHENLSVLELFHGPTLAFKDFALQLLGQFYGREIREKKRRVNIIGATSGDTGSAAIHGMLAQKNAHSFILFPEGKIAPLQERQICCTGSPNVHPIAIQGDFDDAQAIVKTIFGDPDFTAKHALTAVNSINIARILAQCVYYLDAILKVRENENDTVEFIVPTGNFGNILAGWMLGKMGVRGLEFCAATNANSVVSDFFENGTYAIGGVQQTLAPSMDIQQASNFERWLFWHFENDTARVRETMSAIRENGKFTLNEKPAGAIRAHRCDDDGIRVQIYRTFTGEKYIADPHTACAFNAVNPRRKSVILATASPAKFPETLAATIGIYPTHPSLEILKNRPIEKQILPADIGAIRATIATTLEK